jgi:hypothetical protein
VRGVELPRKLANMWKAKPRGYFRELSRLKLTAASNVQFSQFDMFIDPANGQEGLAYFSPGVSQVRDQRRKKSNCSGILQRGADTGSYRSLNLVRSKAAFDQNTLCRGSS